MKYFTRLITVTIKFNFSYIIYKKTFLNLKPRLDVTVLVYDFAVIGGDERLFYLANLLNKKKYSVIGHNVFKCKTENISFKKTNSFEKAILSAKNLIFPIPFSRDNIFINSKHSKKKLEIETLFKNLNKKIENQLIFGGSFTNEIKTKFNNLNVKFFDYMQNENFVVLNASLTAEAAIAQAILKKPIDLNSSKCLILGFGRCGKLLAIKLKNLCNQITIAARSERDTAWAKALGFNFINLKKLGKNLNEFNIVFNTIPFKILTNNLLSKLNKSAFVFDITPNGIDLDEFKKLKIQAEVSLQIPGKFKFKAAAENLEKLILNVLNEQKKINSF